MDRTYFLLVGKHISILLQGQQQSMLSKMMETPVAVKPFVGLDKASE